MLKMVKNLDVAKMVFCPDQEKSVECDECTGCPYYHGMGDLDFTLKCGFEDKEKNEEHEEDE
jgi:hypothetical protein